MSGNSNLGATSHPVIGAVKAFLGVLGPVMKYVKKDAFNPPEVPAKAIAELFLKPESKQSQTGGKFFILDDEVKSCEISLDEKLQDDVWRKIREDLDGKGTA